MITYKIRTCFVCNKNIYYKSFLNGRGYRIINTYNTTSMTEWYACSINCINYYKFKTGYA